jgi:imidazolonepropionase-like amidohydrolase
MLSVVILSDVLIGQSRDTAAQLAVIGGTIYTSPTEEPIRNGVILVDGGKIVAVGRRASVQIPRGADVIDAAGSTITAGFWNSHVHFLERRWMAGMTFPQILASLTTAPAERFGASRQLGRIAPGLTADLTVLRTEPSNDIRALAAVDYTIRDGK